MNKKQRVVLLATASVIFLMLLFPPFHMVTYKVTLNKGYHFILSPPVEPVAATINVGTLLGQCLIVVAIGAICCFALKGPTTGQKTSKRNIKLCPSCNAYQDVDKKECPNCGFDFTDI